jgi:hypothetical protein
MNRPSSGAGDLLDWAWAGTALEEPSGDLHLVASFPGGVLVALIDGLGHGAEAAEAAEAAAAVLAADAGQGVDELMRRCHAALRKTRGVAMTLASLDARTATLSWSGVGNVDAVLRHAGASHARAERAIAQRAGVVGYQLPPLHVDTLALVPGDTLLMATDGIRAGYSSEVRLDGSPQEIARSILERFAKGNDDARVLVARYRGPGP